MLTLRPPAGVTWVIGHRGAPTQAPENTLASFRRAVELGADMFELDVRRSADGVLVVHHDPHLADGRLITATTAADLALPTLAEALAAGAGVLVDIEVKNDPDEPGFEADRALAADVVAVVRAEGDADRVVVSSFDSASVDRVRALGDDIATAWLVEEIPDAVVEVLVNDGHQALHPSWELVTPALIDTCHAAGLAVSCWTCDDPEAMARLARWGIDGICTNLPGLAVEVLRAPR
jgi:glycerophosphoryl diester phosphodiesterase